MCPHLKQWSSFSYFLHTFSAQKVDLLLIWRCVLDDCVLRRQIGKLELMIWTKPKEFFIGVSQTCPVMPWSWHFISRHYPALQAIFLPWAETCSWISDSWVFKHNPLLPLLKGFPAGHRVKWRHDHKNWLQGCIKKGSRQPGRYFNTTDVIKITWCGGWRTWTAVKTKYLKEVAPILILFKLVFRPVIFTNPPI